MHVLTDKSSNDSNVSWVINLRDYPQQSEHLLQLPNNGDDYKNE